MRSACLPDDLRETYNKDDEQRVLSPAPDRFEKPAPTTTTSNVGGNGGSNGIGNNGSSGIGNGDGNGGSAVMSSNNSSRAAATTMAIINSATVPPRNACKYPCLNGGTCQGSVCVCRQGYSGENCADRKITSIIIYFSFA